MLDRYAYVTDISAEGEYEISKEDGSGVSVRRLAIPRIDTSARTGKRVAQLQLRNNANYPIPGLPEMRMTYRVLEEALFSRLFGVELTVSTGTGRRRTTSTTEIGRFVRVATIGGIDRAFQDALLVLAKNPSLVGATRRERPLQAR